MKKASIFLLATGAFISRVIILLHHAIHVQVF